MKWTVLLVAALCAVCNAQMNGKSVVCYVGTWATYRDGDGKFEIEDIASAPCTHVIYAFAGVRDNKLASLDPFEDLCDDGGKCGFQRFTKLKEANPELKTMLAVGGWSEGWLHFSDMAETAETRATFVQSSLEWMEKYGFDGLDIDWEYPGYRPEDKVNFVLLLKDLKEAFGPKGLLVSGALPAGEVTIMMGYDVPAIFEHLDFGSLMLYDFHGSFNPYVHHNAPMYKHPLDDKHGDPTWNMDTMIRYWIDHGAPSEKLMMGLATYGHSFELADLSKTEVYSASRGAGEKGPYTQQIGVLGYNEIAEKQATDMSNWVITRDPYLVGPYGVFNWNGGASNRNQWVGYDDAQSIMEKTTLVDKYNLGGAMVWSLEMDDFRGLYHPTKYPLVSAITAPRPTPDPDWTTTTPTPPPPTTTNNLPPDDICKKEGMNDHPDPANCDTYYQCWLEDGKWYRSEGKCAAGLAFNPEKGNCDWCDHVPGCAC